jgi:large subunit ribosomal protein L10
VSQPSTTETKSEVPASAVTADVVPEAEAAPAAEATAEVTEEVVAEVAAEATDAAETPAE